MRVGMHCYLAPNVIYTCSFLQNGGTEGEKDDDAKKSKRRPRPEPLFIPPPKPGLFIAPPVYSSITPYQSHLRSPVRLPDNPLAIPPYTPPPILSPVREGSGLYFSTFLSSAAAAAAAAAASSQGLPPPATPKSATRSLLRSSEWELKHGAFNEHVSTINVSVTEFDTERHLFRCPCRQLRHHTPSSVCYERSHASQPRAVSITTFPSHPLPSWGGVVSHFPGVVVVLQSATGLNQDTSSKRDRRLEFPHSSFPLEGHPQLALA